MSKLFDAYYFQHGCGTPYERNPAWLSFFEGVAERIVREIGPRTTLDAGCAMGFLVEALRDQNIEAYGLDVSEYAIQQVRTDIKPHCTVGSLTTSLPRRYDLITCIEVLEHMPRAESEQAIGQLCAASDDILFSSTPFDYKETTHFNVQPPEYWAYHFALQGFVRDVDFDASFLTPWAVRFRRNREPWPRVVSAYERRFWVLWKENTDVRRLTAEMRAQQAASESSRAHLQAQAQQALTLKTELEHITASPTWRVLQWWQARLAPPGSWRERWLNRLLLMAQGRSP